MLKFVILILSFSAQLTQAQISFKIIIPSFCKLEILNSNPEQLYYHSLYINWGMVSYVCNNHAPTTLQIDSTDAQNPTRLILSNDENCFNLRNTLQSNFNNKIHSAYICAPANYTPKADEAVITLSSP
ncbi:MAG: hypothetical protein IPM57_06675 [Oligoflexia bacterium]|nr:hypothetical protein [Oligoflexia bacterium]